MMGIQFDVIVKVVVVGVGFVLALAANPLIRWLLRRLDPPAPNDDARLLNTERVLPGGRWIGLLERAAVYATLVAGFPTGLAIIIAIKGLGRYPELRTQVSPRVGELFIIGTMASMLWAAAFAGIALATLWLW